MCKNRPWDGNTAGWGCGAGVFHSHPHSMLSLWSTALCADARAPNCSTAAKNSICLVHYITHWMRSLLCVCHSIHPHSYSLNRSSVPLIPNVQLPPHLPPSSAPLFILPPPYPPPSLKQLPVWSSLFQPKPAASTAFVQCDIHLTEIWDYAATSTLSSLTIPSLLQIHCRA